MTTTQHPHTGGRDSAISLAVRLGLLWQAAFSVAMLRHFVRHGSSFYLDNIAGAWPYVHQHLLWIGAFIAFSTGSRRLARGLAGGGALLAAVQIVSLASGGAQTSEVLTATGVASFGVLPAVALLIPGVISAHPRRVDWLCAGFLVALVLVIFDDGVVQAAGGMSGRQSGMNGILRATWAGWVACILALALLGGGHRLSRLAALASTGHLLVVQLVWLASDVLVQPDLPGSPLRTLLSLDSASRVLMLGAILALLVLLPRPNAQARNFPAPLGRGSQWLRRVAPRS